MDFATRNSNAPLVFREAFPEDDSRICAQMRRNSMPGSISIASYAEPSFFEAAEVEGQYRRVLVAERDGEIAAVGLMARKNVYLNGAAGQIGYISSLRVDESARGTTLLSRFGKISRQWHNESFGLPLYLFSILKDNATARKILTSGRAGLPPTREIGSYYIATIPLIRRKSSIPAGLRIVRGGEIGAGEIAGFLNVAGRQKQFYPVYTESDLVSDTGLLRGLSPNDFHVALAGGRITGVIACWNQLPFRRMVVTGYAGALRLALPLVATLCRLAGLPPLPRAGDALQTAIASCIAVEGNDPAIFKALLDSVLRAERGSGRLSLMVGLMEQDPLTRVLRRFLHMPTRTCIYAQDFRGDTPAFTLDGRIPYIELGSL